MTLRRRLALTVLLTAVPLVAGLMFLQRHLERRSLEDGLRTFAVTHMTSIGRQECEDDPERFGGVLGRPRRGGPLRPEPGRGPDGPRERFAPDGPPAPPDERPLGPPDRRRRGGPRDGRPPPRDGRRPGDGRRGPDGRPPRGVRRRLEPAPGLPARPHRYALWAYDVAYISDNPRAPAFPDRLKQVLDAGAETAGMEYEDGQARGYQLAVRMAWEAGPSAIVIVRRFGGDNPSAVKDVLWGAAIVCAVLLLAVLLTAAPIVRRIRSLTEQVRKSAAARYAKPVEVRGSDEITGLARAFNDAGDELRTHVETIEQREKTMRRFLADTTHDVMLPLTVLQGHLSAMRKHLAAGEPADADLVRYALEEAQYMGSLVHNLSAVAKLEGANANVQRHPLDLVALVERATTRQLTIANARGVEVNHAVPEHPLLVEGDVTLIEQAVSNIIHNAVRYNEEGGHVAVILERQDEKFSLRILDDGPGMPEEQLARLPERRFRGASARTRHPEGSGLGLHIARDVAQVHGFELDFRPSEYGGLEVELSGPLELEE